MSYPPKETGIVHANCHEKAPDWWGLWIGA